MGSEVCSTPRLEIKKKENDHLSVVGGWM